MGQGAGSNPDVSAGRGRLAAFFSSNPWYGIVGTAASIVSVPLAIYLSLHTVSYPELVYYVNPVHTVVIKQGTASRLGVVFDGHRLTQDVTASQVALWNRGRQPIRRAAILQPVTITTEPRAPILEATIRKTTRDVVGFDLDRTHLAEGEVTVWWNILEEGDGGSLQLVYAGDIGTQIHCRGAVEGQRAVQEITLPPGIIKSPEGQLQFQTALRYIFLAYGLFILIQVPRAWRIKIAPYYGWSRLARIFYFLGVPIMIAGACVYFFVFRAIPAPAFGF